MYNMQLTGISSATFQAFESWAHRIIGFQLELIIVDQGGNGVAHPEAPIDYMVADMLLHLQKILDRLSTCLMTKEVITEQHKCSRVPQAMIHYPLYNSTEELASLSVSITWAR